jgi:hypothetical protein
MAKAKTLDQAIDELVENYSEALKEAVTYASGKAVEDIYRHSMTCLEEYYDSYDPLSYNRTDSLWHAIVPYHEMHVKGDQIINRVGVEYNPFVLEKYIENNPAYVGSKSYGTIDSWYVVDNYLEGIHPATNGASDPDKVLYYEIQDPKSPTEKMDEFLSKYAETTFNKNMMVSFAKQIARMK